MTSASCALDVVPTWTESASDALGLSGGGSGGGDVVAVVVVLLPPTPPLSVVDMDVIAFDTSVYGLGFVLLCFEKFCGTITYSKYVELSPRGGTNV